jgi:P27 family predicted phage terminase small subunit
VKKPQQQQTLKPGAPEKPAGLSPLAAREWDRLTAEMKRSGIVLSPAYRALIEQAATLSADIANAWAVIQRDGEYIVNAKSGAVKLHPAATHLSACRARLIFALIALGLSPKKAQAVDDPLENDPMAELLRRPRTA